MLIVMPISAAIAVKSRDGRIHIAGGISGGADGGPCELFDPRNPGAGWILGPSMTYARGYHTIVAVRLETDVVGMNREGTRITELARLAKQIAKLEGDLAKTEARVGNPNFGKAPEHVQQQTRDLAAKQRQDLEALRAQHARIAAL